MDSGYESQVVEDFEVLVDELLKPEPQENLVKTYMENLGMAYSGSSVDRIGMVLEKMNQLIFQSKKRKVANDISKHP